MSYSGRGRPRNTNVSVPNQTTANAHHKSYGISSDGKRATLRASALAGDSTTPGTETDDDAANSAWEPIEPYTAEAEGSKENEEETTLKRKRGANPSVRGPIDLVKF